MVANYALSSETPIDRITLHLIAMPMVEPLTTSFGGGDELRPAVLVELELGGGATGWGEVVAAWTPGYSYETIGTALHVLNDYFIPAVIGKNNLDELHRFRGHPMAKLSMETAFWSAIAESRGLPLGDLLGSPDATLAVIEKRLNEGYRRIKLKIKPGWHIEMLRAVRRAYPDITLMADANSAFTLDDLPLFKEMDDLNLLMIEQATTTFTSTASCSRT
jgi:O-succinylbenzoate synthase